MKCITTIKISLVLAGIISIPYYGQLGWYGIPMLVAVIATMWLMFTVHNSYDHELDEELPRMW